jgi:hypothetical protein
MVSGSPSRKVLLIGSVVGLALLRFAIVPALQTQSAWHERLQVLTKHLDRSVGVKQHQSAILGAEAALKATTTDAQAQFPSTPSVEAYRLVMQQQIGQIVASANLKLTLFDWILDGAVKDAGLSYGRIRMQVDGPLADLAALHTRLEGTLPSLKVREVQVSSKVETAELGRTLGTLTLVGDLFYRVQAAP